MQRAKKGPEKGQKLYRKIGGGSLRISGKIIKPNQKFYATPEELPESFLDLIEEVVPRSMPQPVKAKEEAPPKKESAKPKGKKERDTEEESKDTEEEVYVLQLNKELSTLETPLYDIVTAEGKIVNEIGKPLSEEEASKTVELLLGK